MNKKVNKELLDKINCNIISIIILMNAFQIILSWDFGIVFNMWIEYIIIVLLFIINRFKVVNIRNIFTVAVAGLTFSFNILFNDNETLRFYINEFLLFALPLLLAFMINIDLKYFCKTFYIYNIIVSVLYLLLLIINPDKLIEDYMTFGFYAIFSIIYVLIYSYFNKKTKTMILSIITLPIIFINGNRGTIIIAILAIVLIILMAVKDIRKKIFLIFIIIILGLNIENIAKVTLNFITNELGIRTYSINALSLMLDSDNTEGAIGGRYSIYQEAIDEIKQHPLLGIGLSTFQDKYGYFPHNIFLDAYSTFGIILGTIYFIYLFSMGAKLYRISKEHQEVKILFIFMVANVMKLMLSKTFIYDPTIWLFIALGNFIVEKHGGKIIEKNNNIHTNIQ